MVSINWKVNPKPTKKQFEEMKFIPSTLFSKTAKERFSKLDKDYIYKKATEELFPIIGNKELCEFIEKEISSNLDYYSKKPAIKVIDLGSAGGSLSTLFLLDILGKHNLLEKTKLVLIDVSEKALESTIVGNFYLPDLLFEKYFSYFKSAVEVKAELSKAKYFCSGITNLPKNIGQFDICISGFTFHHLNLQDKQKATSEIERITLEGGVIGLVDECLTYEDYCDWLNAHKNEFNSSGEQVPLAQECFISLEEQKSFFKTLSIKHESKTRYYYCLCGIKQ
ncbi:MAG: class I SAM-dependent methyltransferase [Candidatus ainarchaeum sp.]|nr:class I SAM-dependent methyltransferase [Candidatus ainarchaeum sp.]